MEIRLITPEEYDALGDLTVSAYQRLSEGQSLGGYEEELRDVAARARDSEVYVAIDNGMVVGGVTFVPSSDNAMSEFSDPHAAGVRMLAVSPEFQGTGVGRALLERTVERARELGRRRLLLHSTPVMVVARAMYERHGFARLPEIDVFYSGPPYSEDDPLHLIGYELVL